MASTNHDVIYAFVAGYADSAKNLQSEWDGSRWRLKSFGRSIAHREVVDGKVVFFVESKWRGGHSDRHKRDLTSRLRVDGWQNSGAYQSRWADADSPDVTRFYVYTFNGDQFILTPEPQSNPFDVG